MAGLKKNVRCEVAVRIVKDGTIVHEVSTPLFADLNLETPKMPAPELMAQTDADVLAELLRHYISAASNVSYKAVLTQLFLEAPAKFRQLEATKCVHDKLGECHDCFVDEVT